MHPSTLALAAAVVLGGMGWASAAPLMPSPSKAALEAHRDIELVRRHHRGRGWGYRWSGRFNRDVGDDNAFAETLGRGGPETVRSDRRRRGGWVDPPQGF